MKNTKEYIQLQVYRAGKLLLDVQVIPVRTTAKYTITSFKLQLAIMPVGTEVPELLKLACLNVFTVQEQAAAL